MALRMRIELARLQEKHRLSFSAVELALADPVPYPVIVSGFASTADIDLQRTKFRPHALWWHSLPPLYLAHDETTPVGTVDNLEYDQRGRLSVTATVTHDAAKRCNGFSVGARVLEYEIRNADSADYYAVVTRAECMEVSLSSRPANPKALVTLRYAKPAASTFHDLMIARVQTLTKIVDHMQQEIRRQQ
jgi:hypothetical protein